MLVRNLPAYTRAFHRHPAEEWLGAQYSRIILWEIGRRVMWPTTLGFFFGILTCLGFICVVPAHEGFNILDRIKWALTIGVLVAYGVSFAVPSAT
jgi:hypothetical protein